MIEKNARVSSSENRNNERNIPLSPDMSRLASLRLATDEGGSMTFRWGMLPFLDLRDRPSSNRPVWHVGCLE